jgi:hypothetical protein
LDSFCSSITTRLRVIEYLKPNTCKIAIKLKKKDSPKRKSKHKKKKKLSLMKCSKSWTNMIRLRRKPNGLPLQSTLNNRKKKESPMKRQRFKNVKML